MSSHSNFQSDNAKFEKDRYDVYNPSFQNPLKGRNEGIINEDNIHKWAELVSFLRFYPDIAYDLIAPKEGKRLELDMDQRIALRALVRFKNPYMCVIRGYAKTLLHIMAQYHFCRFYPAISVSITASTKDSAVGIWEDKHNELMEFYPSLQDEIKSAQFAKDKGKVTFVNGSWMDALANTQQTKGKRRRRGGLEESNLIDKDVLEDAVIPVFNTPRRTAGNLIDPEELNGWIGRFTTSGYKNSNEYDVITNICKKMVNMDGGFLIGSDWRLPVYFGRQKFSTINEAREGSLSSFKMNYLCQWIGNSNASLVGINHLINARKLEEFELEILKDKRGRPVISEFVIAVDVARSVSDANNQTAIAVLKITRNLKNKIESIDVVNIKTPSNGLNFTEQALEVKKMFVRYGGSWDLSSSMVKAVVVDSNGIGQGLVEKLLEETRDPETGQIFPAFATINTDEKFEGEEAPNILFSLKSQGINSDIINKFIDYVEGDKLRLIKPWSKIKPDKELFSEEEESCSLFCDQTQRFIDQVANLKLEQASNGKNSVKQVIKKIDKDIFSAIEYGIYYIDMFLQNEIDESEYDYVFNTSTF